MTRPPTLTPDQLAQFDQRGLLRLPGLLSPDRVGRARDYVHGRLARLGLWSDGDWTLEARPRPQWPDSGVKASRDIGNRHPDVEALIGEPDLLAAVDTLLEGHAFDLTLYKRPQICFTLPNADAWRLPDGWHVDAPRLASRARPGVQLFACLDLVELGGGGTVTVAGSHRLYNQGRDIRIDDLGRRFRGEAALGDLCAGTPGDGRTVILDEAVLELVELTGEAGDAWLVDPRVFHAGAPNASDRPRLMATHRFWRADLMPQLAKAIGWT